jgi:hypothetical protein
LNALDVLLSARVKYVLWSCNRTEHKACHEHVTISIKGKKTNRLQVKLQEILFA